MNILITGNGFDLHFGLPTRYSDFIAILIHIESTQEVDFNSAYGQLNSYDKIKESFQEFQLDQKAIKEISESLRSSVLFDIFKDDFAIDTWIDFENRIEATLTVVLNWANKIQKGVFEERSLSMRNNLFNLADYVSQYRDKVILFKLGLIDKVPSRDELFRIKEEFLLKQDQFYIELNSNAMLKYIESALNEFKEIFAKYFRAFVYPLYDNRKVDQTKLNLGNVDHYYTFNYTPTFEYFCSSNAKSEYLHGKIESNVCNIVMGINEVPSSFKETAKLLIPFTKYYQKASSSTDYKFLHDLKKNVTTDFYIWGHSLDRSDRSYVEEIFDVVNEELKSHRAYVIHHDEQAKNALMLNLFDILGERVVLSLMKRGKLIFKLSRELESEGTLSALILPKLTRKSQKA